MFFPEIKFTREKPGIFKPDKFLYEYPIDYAAFSIGNEFIVGYGLDYDQLGRNLKDIYVIDNE